MAKRKEHTTLILLGIFLSVLTYNYCLQAMTNILNDYNGHLYVYLPMFTQECWLDGWQTVPYCMWHLCVLALNKLLHIPLEVSGGYVSCFFVLCAYYTMYWMIQKITFAVGNIETSAKSAAISFGLSIVQAFYFPWLDAGERFMGVFSINPIHNPTQMCVRVFSLLCICLVYDIWGFHKNDHYQGVFFNFGNGIRRYYILLSLLLFLSTLAKPTFVEMFVPAVALAMLIQLLSKLIQKDTQAKAYFTNCLHMFMCSLPALLYILLQFVDYYIWGGNNNAETSIIITKWWEVWSTCSENIPLSILLGMVFPLFIFLIDTRFFLFNDLGRLGLFSYVVGFLEASLLGEAGEKLYHGNFMWPLMSGMLVMWVTSVLHLLVLERNSSHTKLQCILINIAWGIFWIHVYFGLVYINLP